MVCFFSTTKSCWTIIIVLKKSEFWFLNKGCRGKEKQHLLLKTKTVVFYLLSPSAVVQVPFCCLLLNNKKKAKFIYTEDNVFFLWELHLVRMVPLWNTSITLRNTFKKKIVSQNLETKKQRWVYYRLAKLCLSRRFLLLNNSFWTDGIFQNTWWAKIGGGIRIFDRFAGHKKKIPTYSKVFNCTGFTVQGIATSWPPPRSSSKV